MRFEVEFQLSNQNLTANFGEVHNVSDGGYERGYAKGHTDGLEQGYDDGRTAGYAEGLAERKYETWTITLIDGTVIEKDVALL